MLKSYVCLRFFMKKNWDSPSFSNGAKGYVGNGSQQFCPDGGTCRINPGGVQGEITKNWLRGHLVDFVIALIPTSYVAVSLGKAWSAIGCWAAILARSGSAFQPWSGRQPGTIAAGLFDAACREGDLGQSRNGFVTHSSRDRRGGRGQQASTGNQA